MLRTCLKEDSADKFGMARSHKDKVQVGFCRNEQIPQLCPADQLTVALDRLKQQKIALVLGKLVIVSNCLIRIQNSVAGKVDAQRSPNQNLLERLGGALSFSNCDLALGYFEALLDLAIFALIVQLGNQLVLLLVDFAVRQH